MRLSIIANRNGERVFWWPGFVAVTFITACIGMAGFLLGRLLLPVTLFPGLLFAATIPVGIVIGRQLSLGKTVPLDRLKQIE